ncbi:DUF58 domain-containing protein [Ochrobactrum vermis]|uniref:DUF58 domain-containing protein n=1 Tax=Ochrobactrum vermis TaxID=1827297 RepID=A0ABU8PB45_9HYPH|nr:DUF58 domain-containing protein [Ochrobactrum vermis]PQZ29322.1 DUF58 domain-containing protein [Ochrobactrum vermis]
MTTAADQGAYITTQQLVALERQARDLTFVQKKRSHQLLAGRLHSLMRGRGLSFEELREYLPGDDVRSIDWRVTARTGRPVVRVYSEEKERPALLVVDQRINMFFGSRRSMKSVAAAEAAILAAWRILGSGDRIGGIVFNDVEISEIKPHRSRNAVIALADKIADANGRLRADYEQKPNPVALDDALKHAASIAHHDFLVLIVSDFDGHSDATRQALIELAMRNDVVCLLIYDPFMLELPTVGDIVVSSGQLQAELPLGQQHVRKSIDSFARERARELFTWQHELGLPMLPISAAEETAPQLRNLLGQSAWRQRRR